jgi:hypothetical protein
MAAQGEIRTRAPLSPPADLRSATLWRPAEQPVPLDPGAGDFDGGIAWFDLETDGDTAQLFEFLADRCEGLTFEMLHDLLEPDRRPQGEQWGEGEIRLASTFAVYPTETKNGRGDWSCPVPSADLLYQPVELISNGDWAPHLLASERGLLRLRPCRRLESAQGPWRDSPRRCQALAGKALGDRR